MKGRQAEKGRSLREEGRATGNGEVESSSLQWQARSLGYVLWIALGIGAAPLLFVLLDGQDFAPLAFRLFSLGIFVLTLVLALARGMAHPLRTWAFLLVGYGIAGMMFAASGLQGGGRLILVGIPLYGMVFLGPRSGWVAAVMSLALYAVAAFVSTRGLLAPVFASERFIRPEFWLLQGAMMVLVLGPVMVLLNRFIGLLRGALAAQRQAATRIEAAALERRRLERVLLETGERERRAVGHQLHDGPCQQITAALLRCKVAEHALAARGPQEGAAHIKAISEMLDASVGEIHDLARGLSPPELSPASFTSALGDLARRVSAAGDISCELKHDRAACPVDPVTSSQLFRIAQEAVNNAVRHANARRIEIELGRDGRGLQLLVKDDGVGMADLPENDGMGLRIMRHRAELMGGSLSTGPAPGGGTLVNCSIPLSSPQVNQEGGA